MSIVESLSRIRWPSDLWKKNNKKTRPLNLMEIQRQILYIYYMLLKPEVTV